MNCGTTQVEVVMMRSNDASHNTNNPDLPSYEITNTHITTRRATAWHAAWWRISQVDDEGVGYR